MSSGYASKRAAACSILALALGRMMPSFTHFRSSNGVRYTSTVELSEGIRGYTPLEPKTNVQVEHIGFTLGTSIVPEHHIFRSPGPLGMLAQQIG